MKSKYENYETPTQEVVLQGQENLETPAHLYQRYMKVILSEVSLIL